MKEPSLFRLGVCFLSAVWMIASLPQSANALSSDPLDDSLASNLVKSRAQVSIFKHDDQLDLDCQDRTFVSSQVVSQPRVVNQDLNERKWLERWALNRCGSEVSYHVYFTEVGEGGAYFSYRQVDAVAYKQIAKSVRTLKLRNPRMKGDDVQALQKALLDQGYPVSTDGIFGPKTHSAVMAYQATKGLAKDGIAGPATLTRLSL